MELVVGSILPGKVTGITKFGAFVSLAPGKSGLVHISEIANTYVSEVSEFLTVGQDVNVKVLSIDAGGRINLSIKAALPDAPAQDKSPRPAGRPAQTRAFSSPRPQSAASARKPAQTAEAGIFFAQSAQTSADPSFEDKLKKFMQLSDSKIADVRQYSERGGGRRRRK